MAIKYAKWPENWSNGHKIYKHLQLLDPPKFTQIGIFGVKINHLATLESISRPRSSSLLGDRRRLSFYVAKRNNFENNYLACVALDYVVIYVYIFRAVNALRLSYCSVIKYQTVALPKYHQYCKIINFPTTYFSDQWQLWVMLRAKIDFIQLRSLLEIQFTSNNYQTRRETLNVVMNSCEIRLLVSFSV
jgi:hypothetical protein